ncbi:hypothetical protein [Flocculibacter collagenilyticus]|uniref:hypothetical protein n=1 Tax=Flocculibacter collagenilyticus TaxID=2744479 RepID=UPI0018F5983C|nr:hypothetical protein [Flocculibacter collagenilyticus]
MKRFLLVLLYFILIISFPIKSSTPASIPHCFDLEEKLQLLRNSSPEAYNQNYKQLIESHQNADHHSFSNKTIDTMYHMDQHDRRSFQISIMKDAERSARVENILQSQLFLNNMDKFHSAILLMHTANHNNFYRALQLALSIKKNEPTFPSINWLVCASEDRYRLHSGKPQIWGTQYGIGGRKAEPYDRKTKTNKEKSICFQ